MKDAYTCYISVIATACTCAYILSLRLGGKQIRSTHSKQHVWLYDWNVSYLQTKMFIVSLTCQPLESYKSTKSSRWRVILHTSATGHQSWDGSTQLHITTLLMWQPNVSRGPLLHSWRLQHLLVYTALRLLVLLTLLNRQHLGRPLLLTYRVTRTRGRHRHSTSFYNVSNIECNKVLGLPI